MNTDWTQTERPRMAAEERGRMFAPDYGNPNADFTVKTEGWEHICPCRFGEPRTGQYGAWTGDSFRYDIFRRADNQQIALRCHDGSGDMWLIDNLRGRSGESHLLALIESLPDEARRWDACHFLRETAIKSASAAQTREHSQMCVAFAEKRLKLRRRGSMKWVEILPTMTECGI